MQRIIGMIAPNWKLEGVIHGEMKWYELSELRGKWVVFFFYPLDFTFVCPTEVKGFQSRIADFEKLNSVVFGCSVDSVHSHKAWIKELGGLDYPLLSDFQKAVTKEYGVLIEEEGTALRGTFIIDPEGVIKWATMSDNNVGRSVDETLRVLEALQTGELCPIDWHHGQQTLGKS